MTTRTRHYIYKEDNLRNSEPTKYRLEELPEGWMSLNMGPQHPSTHGVLRLEVLTDGEIVREVIPHIGYLHRCFEKHAEALPYNQIIPYVDRTDYLSAMNMEHGYALAVEKLLGLEGQLPKRLEYSRVLVAELNRLASHFIAVGTYGMDIGAFTPFLWLMRDREHILRLLEWLSGARLLYNYIWVGGLFYDLPVGFEQQVLRFCDYLEPHLKEVEKVLIENPIFISRTADVGVLSISEAVNLGASGAVLRGSGIAYDIRREEPYSVYPEIEFEIPIGVGLKGTQGDCWDRNYVRYQECWQSLKIIRQCCQKLLGEHKATRDYNPQALAPKKIRPKAGSVYARIESPRGEAGFFIQADGKNDIPQRVRLRAASFSNLSLINHISEGHSIADLVAIIGSLDFVMGDVDR